MELAAGQRGHGHGADSLKERCSKGSSELTRFFSLVLGPCCLETCPAFGFAACARRPPKDHACVGVVLRPREPCSEALICACFCGRRTFLHLVPAVFLAWLKQLYGPGAVKPTRHALVVLLVLRVVKTAVFSKIGGLEMGSEAYVHALYLEPKMDISCK